MPINLRGVTNEVPIITASQAGVCDELGKCRTLSDIIWTCLVTVFLCAWVSIHPNIQGPEEKWRKIFLRRVGLTACVLLVPEFVVVWAMRQRNTASHLEEQYKHVHGWTITHGFFAVMGGFMYFDGNRPEQTLLVFDTDHLGEIELPRLTEEEINDRSKGDLLSKGMAVLQTVWFIIECIARKKQGLPITELEIVTLAFAFINLVLYVLWWSKPQDVKCAVRVYKRNTLPVAIWTGNGKQQSSTGGSNGEGVLDKLRSAMRVAYARFRRATRLACAFVCGLPMMTMNEVLSGFHLLQSTIKTDGWLFWIKPFNEMLLGSGEDYIGEEKRVATFSPLKKGGDNKGDSLSIALPFVAVGTVFGGIHCFAWYFTFPSLAELILWRVSSITITSIPLLTVALAVLLAKLRPEQYKFPGDCLWTITLVQLAPYAICRVTLLILPFLSLRSLPPDAYKTVTWTTPMLHLQ